MTDTMYLWLALCTSICVFSWCGAAPMRRQRRLLGYRQWHIIHRPFYDWKELGWA